MNCFGSHTHWFGHAGTTHSNNTSIRHLSWHLANYIATNFTAKGIAVDVVAHSMGGLMIRYALTKQGVDSFPRLMVEDVVTLGSPHNGASFAALTGTTQGAEMEPNSSLIAWLTTWGMHPKGSGGTDWTVIGSHGDLIVQEGSATAMSAPHRWRYTTSPNWIFHRDYMKSSAPGSTRRCAVSLRLVAGLVRNLHALPRPDDPCRHEIRDALASPDVVQAIRTPLHVVGCRTMVAQRPAGV